MNLVVPFSPPPPSMTHNLRSGPSLGPVHYHALVVQCWRQTVQTYVKWVKFCRFFLKTKLTIQIMII